MANKKKNGERKAKWVGFASCYVDADQFEQFDRLDLDGVEILRTVSDLVGEGYGFSVKFDTKNDAFVASLTGQYEGMVNAGMTLTAFSDNVTEAIGLLLFKHFTVLAEKWSVDKPIKQRRRG